MSDHGQWCLDNPCLLTTDGDIGPAEEDDEIVSMEHIQDNEPESYSTGGGKVSYHGITYQGRLLMYFLLHGINNQESFCLATEMKEAGKFDDLIFRYQVIPNGPFAFRMVQAKHRTNKNYKITLQALLQSKCKGDFALRNYFNSFLEMKQDFNGGKEIRDLIIYTNADFKYGDTEGGFCLKEDLFEVRKNDQGGDMDELFETKLLCFKKGSKFLVDFLRGTDSKKSFDEKDVECFLGKLCFAMKQPGNKELKEKITQLIKVNYSLRFSEDMYSLYQGEIFEWMMKVKGTYLTVDDGKSFFDGISKKYGRLHFEYVHPVFNFTGRMIELEEFRIAREIGRVTVISGLGGIGKTELVRKYIGNNLDKFDRILWINSESRESLINCLHTLAFDTLNIKKIDSEGKARSFKCVLREMYNMFMNGKSVFIFDNVECSSEGDEQEPYIKMFLPPPSKSLFVILTSRYQLWCDYKVIAIGTISEIDAAQIIRTSLNINDENEEKHVMELVNKLQCFPLALQQAIAYMKVYEGQITLEGYLKKYDHETRRLLDFKQPNCSNCYRSTTMTTWNVTLHAIKLQKMGGAAHKTLKLLTYFSSENILIQDVKEYFRELSNDEMMETLSLLKQYSLITIKDNKLGIHRLLQQVIRINLEECEEQKILTWIVEKSDDIEVKHSVATWHIMKEKQEFFDKTCELQIKIIKRFIHIHRYEEGYSFGKICVDNLREKCSCEDDLQLSTLFYYAVIARCKGEYKESLNLLEEVITKQKHSLDDDHPNVLKTWHEIASALSSLGEDKKALSVLEDVLQKEMLIFGENHPNIFSTRHDIASALSSLGEHKKALPMFEDVLQMETQILGEDHPNIFTTMHEIATALSSLGEHKKALPMFEVVLQEMTDIFDEDHPSVLTTRYQIAVLYKCLGECNVALSIFEDIYAIGIDKLGSTSTLICSTERHITSLISKVNSNNNISCCSIL